MDSALCRPLRCCDKKQRDDGADCARGWRSGALYLSADGLVDGIIKPLAERCRPSSDPMFKYTVQVVDNMRLKSFSFCSAHAANTLSLAIFFSLLIRSKLVTWTLLLWSLVNCWTRLYLGVHYPVDILCGLAIGAVVGVVVYLIYIRMYYRISPKIKYISNQYTSTGYDYDDVDKIMTVVIFTLIMVVFLCHLSDGLSLVQK